MKEHIQARNIIGKDLTYLVLVPLQLRAALVQLVRLHQ